jgi:spore maturation protein CgeB
MAETHQRLVMDETEPSKLIVAGDWHSRVHEEPVYAALLSLGHDVHRFEWHRYFDRHGHASTLRRLVLKTQNKYLAGPAFHALNRDLILMVARHRPDMLFVYRGTHVTKSTLQAIRAASPATVLVGYNNDDPFSPSQPRHAWRHFLSALPFYDLVLAYRERNIQELVAAGARRAELLRSWFVPERHRPMVLTPSDAAAYESDVVFVGHYEDDGRLEMLEALARAGVRVRVFGPGRGFKGYDWDRALRRSPHLAHLAPTHLAWDDEYVKALCGSKMALCFLSKLNRDTYTRRSFEIPATQTLMLSEYTDDLATLFVEGQEAEFFRSAHELVGKALHYLAHPEQRRAVAEAGARRVHADGHDVRTRMQQVLRWTQQIARERA